MLDLIYLLAYVVAFNAALLVCYGLVRLAFLLTGREWRDYQ